MKSADMMSVTKYAGCRALRSGNVPALLSRFPLNFHETNALNDLFPVQARLPYQGEASGKFWKNDSPQHSRRPGWQTVWAFIDP
jgi:hypothetical protein